MIMQIVVSGCSADRRVRTITYIVVSDGNADSRVGRAMRTAVSGGNADRRVRTITYIVVSDGNAGLRVGW
jgi:hypothetical protein